MNFAGEKLKFKYAPEIPQNAPLNCLIIWQVFKMGKKLNVWGTVGESMLHPKKPHFTRFFGQKENGEYFFQFEMSLYIK